MYLWLKSFHVIFMVTWFAGLFYLPRLFVYHAMADQTNQGQIDTFKTMERKLLVMTHLGGGLTLLFGLWLLFGYVPGLAMAGWMHAKLTLIVALIVYHGVCVKLVADFRNDRNTRTHRWYRVFNELPVLALVGVVILVIVRPF